MTSGFELPAYPLAEFHSYSSSLNIFAPIRIQNNEFPRVGFKAGTQETVEQRSSVVQKRGARKAGFNKYRE
jgi:hypothetical protein